MRALQMTDHLDEFQLHWCMCPLERIPSGLTWCIKHTCPDWFVLTTTSQRISLYEICFSYFGLDDWSSADCHHVLWLATACPLSFDMLLLTLRLFTVVDTFCSADVLFLLLYHHVRSSTCLRRVWILFPC